MTFDPAADAGGRGAQGEAATPGAGPGWVFTHDRIEAGERCAGEKPGFGFRRIFRASPGRKRRCRGRSRDLRVRTNWGASMRTVPCGGAFSQREAPKAPRPPSGLNVRYLALSISYIYRNQTDYYTVKVAEAQFGSPQFWVPCRSICSIEFEKSILPFNSST